MSEPLHCIHQLSLAYDLSRVGIAEGAEGYRHQRTAMVHTRPLRPAFAVLVEDLVADLLDRVEASFWKVGRDTTFMIEVEATAHRFDHDDPSLISGRVTITFSAPIDFANSTAAALRNLAAQCYDALEAVFPADFEVRTP